MGAGALHPLSRKSNNGVSVADAEEPPRCSLLRPRAPPPLSPHHSQQVSASMDSPSPQAARRRISHARQGQDACASGRVGSIIQARRHSRQEPERPGSEVIERGRGTAGRRPQTAGACVAAAPGAQRVSGEPGRRAPTVKTKPVWPTARTGYFSLHWQPRRASGTEPTGTGPTGTEPTGTEPTGRWTSPPGTS